MYISFLPTLLFVSLSSHPPFTFPLLIPNATLVSKSQTPATAGEAVNCFCVTFPLPIIKSPSSSPNAPLFLSLLSQVARLRYLGFTMFRWKHSQNHEESESLQHEAKIKELKVSLGPLSGREAKFCTDACLRRYLDARSWNVDKAKKMLEETLKWRATYKPEEIRWHEVAHEGETGKVSRANFVDRDGRPVLIMRPGKQNTTSAEGNIRHLVYLLENTILNLPEGQEQMSWLIDYTGFSLSTSVSVRTAREIIHILQSHYPERLAVALLYNPPRIFQAFWKAVKYFLDPKTSQKVKFVYPKNKDSIELMSSYFDVENLPKEFGGNATLEYDHEEFSRLMAEDDVKTAKIWGFDDKPTHLTNGYASQDVASLQPINGSGHSKAEVAPEPF